MRAYRAVQLPAPEGHGTEYERADIADGQGSHLQNGQRAVQEAVGRAVFRADYQAVGGVGHARVGVYAYLDAALAVGDFAVRHDLAGGVVDCVHLAPVGGDIDIVPPAVGDLDALAEFLISEVHFYARPVEGVYENGADDRCEHGRHNHVPDKGRRERHVAEIAACPDAPLSGARARQTKPLCHFAHL